MADLIILLAFFSENQYSQLGFLEKKKETKNGRNILWLSLLDTVTYEYASTVNKQRKLRENMEHSSESSTRSSC